MATNVIIKGTIYKLLTPNNQNFIIDPTDLNGNLFPEVTLAVDSTISATTIYLPEISTLNGNWAIAINAIKSAGGNNSISIVSSGTDKIGSGTSINLGGIGSNAILTPVENGVWSNTQTF
jgi:hypothetical protein